MSVNQANEQEQAESMSKKTTGDSDQSAGPSLESEMIRELAELLTETGLSEIEIEKTGLRIRVARNLVAASYVEAPAYAAARPQPSAGAPTAAGPAGAAHPGAVPSPMVGTAYLSAEPGAAPFVNVGDTVTQGQTLMIVEAMKTMNQIPAPRAGKITAILIENGQPVEYGEPLMIIE
jgi:acetyl-CoA carboxylase biotin carboxyl carrier protein